MKPLWVFGGNFTRLISAMITIGPRNSTTSSVTGANRMPIALRVDPRRRRPGVTATEVPTVAIPQPPAAAIESVPAIMPRVASSPVRARNSMSAAQINSTCTSEMTAEIELTTAV